MSNTPRENAASLAPFLPSLLKRIQGMLVSSGRNMKTALSISLLHKLEKWLVVENSVG